MFDQVDLCSNSAGWRMQRISKSLLIVLLVVGTGPLRAQVPSPAQPRVTPPIAVPETTPKPVPELEVTPVGVKAPPGAEKIRVVVQKIVVEHSSVYGAEELRETFTEVLGREVSLIEVFAVADRIQARYRKDGYVLTRVLVPRQTVKEGIFRIRVVEGFIDRVRIEGDVGPVSERARAYLEHITESRPVREQDLERYLLLVTDLPGVTASGVLRRGTGETGAAELVVKLERKPYQGYVMMNNRGSKYTGPTLAALSVQENSATVFGEALQGLFIPTPGSNEQRYGLVSYNQALGSEGLRVGAFAGYNRTRPGYELSDFDITGKTEFGQFSLSYPLVRARTKNLSIEGGLQATNTTEEGFGERFVEDRSRILFIGLNADLVDGWAGQSSLSVNVGQGLSALGASDEGDANLSPADAVPDATVVRVSAERFQPFGASSWGLMTAMKGQYAWDPLLVDQQITMGGQSFGRGYDPAEIAGDRGVALSLELRYTRGVESTWLQGYQAYAFYDFGAVWDLAEPRGDQSLASSGFGVRARLGGSWFLDFEIAKPLTRVPETQRDNDPRFYVQLMAGF